MNDYRYHRREDWTGLEIAIVGMTCRFPGANDLESFWENLKEGVESITFFDDNHDTQGYVPARGQIKGEEEFDAAFFGYKVYEAELMDPQTRIFYECCWDALEMAGYNPEGYEGLIGLYAGANNNRPWEINALLNQRAQSMGSFAVNHFIDRDFLATRIAFRLNLRGPAVTVKTACSTALVAVDMAARALLTGQCEMALAGGVTVFSGDTRGYTYQEGMIMSPDGHCRAFDAGSNGVLFSDGAGVVLLKRLVDALEDGDTIHAIIRGSAVNNDGNRKGAFQSPCIEGQAEAIQSALHMAEVHPETISYIEAHGTGTEIGDPIEIAGLIKAFDTEKKQFCPIGSVKTNFGHLDTAAGIAGLIKTVLALKHRMIPPNLHFNAPNPRIDFSNSPFYVNGELSEWKVDTDENGNEIPRRAGVSSFGIGGTNAHVILEETPPQSQREPLNSSQPVCIALSALSETALNTYSETITAALSSLKGNDLRDAAYTLQTGRKPLPYRKIWVVDPDSPDFSVFNTAKAREKNRVVFMFSGQGAQYVDMGLGIYQREPVFQQSMDRCFELLEDLSPYDFKSILYPGLGSATDQGNIDQTEITQPMLFIFEYSLAKLLQSLGIQPYAMVGHSIGEYVAACLAGVFSLEDALKIVTARGTLMQEMPSGDMLSVSLPEDQVQPILKDYPDVSLAAVNAPSFCVLSGPAPSIDRVEQQLSADGRQCRRLHTSHAFHSSMMDPVLQPFEDVFRDISLHPPAIPYISNVSGSWITVEEATSPSYWARHLRSAVRFSDGLDSLFQEENTLFLEVGPGRGLTTLVKKHGGRQASHIVLNLVKHPNEDTPDERFLVHKLGQIWLYGETIDWYSLYSKNKPYRIPLPTYPYQRQHYTLPAVNMKALEKGEHFGTTSGKREDISQWFYLPSWKRSLTPRIDALSADGTKDNESRCWWFFMDEAGLGSRVADMLEEEAADQDFPLTLIRILPGSGFENMGNILFTVDPQKKEDYLSLVTFLKKTGQAPQKVVHMWSVDHQNDLDIAQYRGFYSLLFLAQALGEQGIDKSIQLNIISSGLQQVTGNEQLNPLSAGIYGPAMVIPIEYPNINTRCIDILLPPEGDPAEERLAQQLMSEIAAEQPETMVAYREFYRMVRNFESVPLMKLAGSGSSSPYIPRLSEDSVVLITGGTGGIGLEIAKHLFEIARVKLVLTGRTALPDEADRQQWVDTHGNEDKISRKILAIKALKDAGAEVLIAAVDVSDQEAMNKLVTDAETAFGPVNAVIHAAGLPGGGMIQLKTPEQAESVMVPKIQGALVLDQLFKDRDLEFMLFCSSINSVMPMMGQVDYFAANAFLDTFAGHLMSRSDSKQTTYISVNWDTWQDVGMAVEAARKLSGIKDSDHPLFDHLIKASAKKQVYSTRFTFEGHWVLNEHKITESGKGLVPGVTYIEMARAAFQSQFPEAAPGTAIEISDVYFLNPLIVGPGEAREARFHLDAMDNSNGCRFMAYSRGIDSSGEPVGEWERHAAGNISRVNLPDGGRPVIHNLQEITARCTRADLLIDKDKVLNNEGIITFGPRWMNIRRAQLGELEALATMELDEAFANELDVYLLHPAILDTAVAFFFPQFNLDKAFIPFSYKRLIVNAPLPSRLYSYSRYIDDEGQAGDSATSKFDILIMDEQGRELVRVDQFTMLQVSEDVKGRLRGKDAIQSELTAVDDDGQDKQRRFLEHAIKPREGMEVLDRILAEHIPQIIVSTLDLVPRLASGAQMEKMLEDDASEPGEQRQTAAPRPDISTVYVAPRTDTELKIAAVWQRVLGVEKVGLNDDFFELGGDSLNIVQLNNELKQIFKKDIPVAVMFRYQNIQAFSKYLQQEETGAPAVEDRSEEIKKSKDRLKARMRRR